MQHYGRAEEAILGSRYGPSLMFGHFFQGLVNGSFKARSVDRDAETDCDRLGSIELSMDKALDAAMREHTGLSLRLQEVIARAAIFVGNDTFEYLTREAADTDIQNEFDKQIVAAERRLEQLSHQLETFQFLKSEFKAKFRHCDLPHRGTHDISSLKTYAS
jgi:hypothetical protein